MSAKTDEGIKSQVERARKYAHYIDSVYDMSEEEQEEMYDEIWDIYPQSATLIKALCDTIEELK